MSDTGDVEFPTSPSRKAIRVKNRDHPITGADIGGQHRTALGAIIGVTPGQTDEQIEYEKAIAAADLAIDLITDASLDGNEHLRRRIATTLDVALGTVPTYDIYRAIAGGATDNRSAVLGALERHAADGVDFVVIHPSSRIAIPGHTDDRIIPITSRGGAMMNELMSRYDYENPYLTCLDEVLELCAAWSLTINIAATYRPGTIVDAMHPAHIEEMEEQGRLVRRAHARGVKVAVEVLNHVPLNLIPEYCGLAAQTLDGAPFGALGPSPTDIAVSFDHVAGVVGAAVASMHGASWINCITAAEHCHMPTRKNLVEAIKYFQVGVHIGYVARTGNIEQDYNLSVARSRNDWSGMSTSALHPHEAIALFEQLGYHTGQACSVCGGACPLVRTRSGELRQIHLQRKSDSTDV